MNASSRTKKLYSLPAQVSIPKLQKSHRKFRASIPKYRNGLSPSSTAASLSLGFLASRGADPSERMATRTGGGGWPPRLLTVALVFLVALGEFSSSSTLAKTKWGKGKGRGKSKGNPGPANRPNGADVETCKLQDQRSGAIFDLSPLHRMNMLDKKFFVIYGASGGPFDHVDTVYDYHFTLCGALPPVPLNCLGSTDIFKAPAYQIARQKPKEKAGEEALYPPADPDEGQVIQNCHAIGSHQGTEGPWTYSLIDKDDPSAGIQIDYKGGQECFKRTVVKTKLETGRDKREVKWLPTPRSTTIKLTCNPQSKTPTHTRQLRARILLLIMIQPIYARVRLTLTNILSHSSAATSFPHGQKKDKHGNIQRLVGRTQTVHATEDEMCHYELTWESPYGCPTNKPIKSYRDRRDDDIVFTEDGGGFHRSTRGDARRATFLGTLLKTFFFLLICLGLGIGVQMARHHQWMPVILPQLFDNNRLQRKIAWKKFTKLMTTIDTSKTNRRVPSGAGRLV